MNNSFSYESKHRNMIRYDIHIQKYYTGSVYNTLVMCGINICDIHSAFTDRKHFEYFLHHFGDMIGDILDAYFGNKEVIYSRDNCF